MTKRIIRIFLCTLLLLGISERINAMEITGDKDEKEARRIPHKSIEQQDKILKTILNMESAYFDRREDDKGNSVEYKTMKCIINHFIEITESKLGFIIKLMGDEEGKYNYSQVASGEDEGVVDKYLERWLECLEKKGEKGRDYHSGIINKVKNGPLIINDFKECNELANFRKDHPPINSFLGLPLSLKNNLLLGIVCLANRKDGYNEDLVTWMEPVTILSSHLLNNLNVEHLRKEAEKQRIACERAKAANEAKTTFLAHMSHEIRTPLTGILGLLDLIQDERLLGEDLNYLRIARTSGVSLMGILNNILDISKIESQQITLEKIEVNPIKIAKELIQLYYPESKKQNTSLTLNINPDIPACLIGDPVRFRQILSNLISNAVKFTKGGSVSVTLTGQECPENNVFFLNGVVADTGIGINPEVLSRLFQPFTQADKSTMRQFGGSGLGLYITKALCEVMGGEIKVTSQLGVGSNFQFSVKMGLPKKQDFLILKNSSEESENLKNLSGLRILIAEDNPVCRLYLKRILDTEECSTTIVDNGLKAVEATKIDSYDLILMNGEMPVMNGLEATKRIRQMFNHQDLPIIGVTAHELEQRKRFLDSGMDGYLTKPIEKDVLKAEILRCLAPCRVKKVHNTPINSLH